MSRSFGQVRICFFSLLGWPPPKKLDGWGNHDTQPESIITKGSCQLPGAEHGSGFSGKVFAGKWWSGAAYRSSKKRRPRFFINQGFIHPEFPLGSSSGIALTPNTHFFKGIMSTLY